MLSSISRVLLVHRAPAVTVTALTRTYTSVSGYGDIDQTGYGASLDGQSSRATTEAEHPGREPVKEGRGSGSGGHEKTGGEPDGQKQAAVASGSGGGGDKEKGGDHHRPQPKILDDSQSTQCESEATKQHNREMDQRYDHEKDGKNDKVDKGYWKGQGGGQRGP